VRVRWVWGEFDDSVGPLELGEHVGYDHDRLILLSPRVTVVPEVDVGTAIESLVGLVKQQDGWICKQARARLSF